MTKKTDAQTERVKGRETRRPSVRREDCVERFDCIIGVVGNKSEI